MSKVRDPSKASVALRRYGGIGTLSAALAFFAHSPQLAANSTDPLAADATVTLIQRLGPQTGWAANEQTLYWTETGGARWEDITPQKESAERIAAVTFTDTSNGFVLLASDDPNRHGSPLRIASTTDGGATWSLTPLEVNTSIPTAALSGGGSIAFTDALHGVVLLRIAGSANFSRGVLLETANGGQSWSRLPDPPVAGEIQFTNPSSGRLVGGPDATAVYLTRDGGHTWTREAHNARTPAPLASVLADVNTRPANVLADGTVTAASAYSTAQGWALVTAGRCTAGKTGCKQVTQVLATEDSGNTWSEITPRVSASLQITPFASAPVSINGGFDTCSAPSASAMGRYWQSPFGDVNLYIGGVNRACGQPNLTSSWVSTVASQGWSFMPTWVGLQSPCSSRVGTRFSSDPGVARAQAINEARSAQAAARALGLDRTVIYYDMEYYNTDPSCGNAVTAFVDAWVSEMHAAGFKAGIYGSPYDASADWLGATPPDVVWLASWNGVASVWNIPPLGNDLWAFDQRVHQYRGGHNETWNGITLNIDSDVVDATVARP